MDTEQERHQVGGDLVVNSNYFRNLVNLLEYFQLLPWNLVHDVFKLLLLAASLGQIVLVRLNLVSQADCEAGAVGENDQGQLLSQVLADHLVDVARELLQKSTTAAVDWVSV